MKASSVSACRAMNAEVVISVNLNAQLVGVPLSRQFSEGPESGATQEELTLWDRLVGYFSSDDEDERKRGFNVTHEEDVTEEEMEAFRMKRQRKEDPMAAKDAGTEGYDLV